MPTRSPTGREFSTLDTLKVYAYHCMIMQPARVRSRDDLQGRAPGRGTGTSGQRYPWDTSTMTDLVVPGVPFPLEASGNPACQVTVSGGSLTLISGAKSDLFMDP